MLEMRIGEIEAFKCVEAHSKECSCDDCAFFNEYEGCMNVVDILGPCKKGDRMDRKDVIFVSTDPNEIIHEKNQAAGNEDQLKNEDLKPFVKILRWCMENDTDHCDITVITEKGDKFTIAVEFSEVESGCLGGKGDSEG